MNKVLIGVFLTCLAAAGHAGFYVDDDAPVEEMSKPQGQLAGAIRPQAERAEWVSEKGATLRKTLESWANRAGWDLEWSVVDGEDSIDYPLAGTLRSKGSIDQAVARVVRLYKAAEVPLKADISVGEKYIRITAAGTSK